MRKIFNKSLKKIGLNNIQYSVFLGKIPSKKIEIIKRKAKILEENDKLCILEIRKDMISHIKFFDRDQSLNYILSQKSSEFF